MLTVDKMSVFYDDFEAVKQVSMSFEEKGITALIGPSGCGKSTFLKSLNRMNDLVPGARVTGAIEYQGKDIYDEAVDVTQLRQDIGLVFQQPNPFPFSIYENVVYGLKANGIKDKAILDEAVETSLRKAAIWDEVKDKLNSRADSLSGGQQQRVCIARVLAMNPKVILMDEPTSALDPISTKEIEEMLDTIKREHTIIMVTHNLQQASRISDKTAFFSKGHLIEFGPTKDIFLTPQEKATENYIAGKL
ncbi:phosphate ABC transporter ATP-binding protein [Vagococcus coleopterorum]|uniref:Phosphate ABC transporter ATP-binding protein n=1 Tax=Vagococcus coleopterorum TaxID=2714946 RepID=A0A6G8ANH1_9ENTE|nr:phosphate ABC transporter ATP-binding protein PstB [Vagococcus coleopterorum]QIL46475.1 phosphate ABC transporter ATP-binding protein [Vagococcus coleopterorum]